VCTPGKAGRFAKLTGFWYKLGTFGGFIGFYPFNTKPILLNTATMETKRLPLSPFTLETALQKVQAAEDAWNTKNPETVSRAYTIDTEWRNRTDFIQGREEVKAFLTRKWEKELDYKLKKELWSFLGNRIAVRFEYEWHDHTGQWFRSYGNENWEFDEDGYMQKRYASINDLPIQESDRRIR
jgi:nuclear transport factor 2 (NTF2) superfamily protein